MGRVVLAPDVGWQEVTFTPQGYGGRCPVAPSRALLCSNGAPAMPSSAWGRRGPPFPWQCPPKAPLPQPLPAVGARLGGSGQGWHREPPQPCNDSTGGKTAAWVVTGGQLGCHGDRGVSLLTQGECGGRKGQSLGELSPIPGCSTTGILVGWAAWMLLHTGFGGSLGTCPASQKKEPSDTPTRIPQ